MSDSTHLKDHFWNNLSSWFLDWCQTPSYLNQSDGWYWQ